VETTWRKKDRGRLVVRLQLLASTDGTIDINVEDVTRLRDVEERLRQAQRMEAVGRLASEVAATCDSLLRDASLHGQQWLAETGGNTPSRQQGEQVLGDVSRAASYLRQLSVYGNQQVSALEPVSVQRVLRDLEPVLKRVAGDNIELVLPKTSASVDVDVEAERVERVLVNVASYARERMPHGGRVKIDLATTMVDRAFVARHPNVRPGAHVLITVTEIRGADRPSLPPDLQAEADAVDANRSSSVKPGVDVGALVGLIAECGGHLWMAAEPPGNMTLKIHLPKRAQDDVVEAGAPGPRGDRRGKLAGWFRH
jgi:nitrogen-specific signal transduction histidine kinase